MDLILSQDKAKDAWVLADNLAKSKMIPYNLYGKTADVFAIMLMGHEKNIPAMTALQEINVIQGKPTLSVFLLTGQVYKALPNALISPEIDRENNIATCFCARDKERPEFGYTAKWDIERATQMGLIGKDNYKKQLLNMLRCRATAEACRVVFPDIVLGLYVPEEFQNTDGKELKTVVNEIQELDEHHPIPEEQKEIGSPDYMIQYGKFRGKQLKDIDVSELGNRVEYLEKKIESKGLSPKYQEELTSITNYLTELETIEVE